MAILNLGQDVAYIKEKENKQLLILYSGRLYRFGSLFNINLSAPYKLGSLLF